MQDYWFHSRNISISYFYQSFDIVNIFRVFDIYYDICFSADISTSLNLVRKICWEKAMFNEIFTKYDLSLV